MVRPSVRFLCPWLVTCAALGCAAPSPPADAAVLDAIAADALTADAAAPETWQSCDPIVPSHCGFPFPNDVYTRPDTTSATGLRLSFVGRALPSRTVTTAFFEPLDGFSPVSSPMTHMPGATVTGLVGQRDLAASLDATAKTVLLDLDTGVRVAHFAELDQAYDNDAERALLLRPAIALTPSHHYAVAIRGVVDAAGAVLPASPVFAALRDGTPSDDPAVTDRRAAYDALLSRLAAAGIDRAGLQIAWSFTVGSRASLTSDLVAMRDRALAIVGTAGPSYEITNVETLDASTSPHIALRVTGVMHVPNFLTQVAPGGRLRRDASGLPIAQGERPAQFWMLVPRSAATTPARPVQWGHGLLGSGDEIFDFDTLYALADTYGFVIFAVDWTGMARTDLGYLANVAVSGDMGRFATVTERLEQGILESLVAMRLVRGALASDPMIALAGHSPIDTTIAPVFVGQSQGGILGGTYMALTTDVPRGVLLVPGQGYSFLLQRNSGGWGMFSGLFEANYRPLDVQRCLALMQLVWDRAEPSGFTPYVLGDRLPGTPEHEVLMMVARNDHQVSMLAGHQMARTMGVPLLGPPNHELYGIATVDRPHSGSAMIEVEFGVPAVPDVNRPATEGVDPHTIIFSPTWAAATLHGFITDGVVDTTCVGPCDPE